MAKPSLNDLTYGLIGQAIYSTEQASWSFDRAPGHRGTLHQLGSWKTALPPAKQLDGSPQTEHKSQHVQQRAKLLARNKSELIPALELLPGLVQESAAVISTVGTYDPLVGDLLSFGKAYEGHHKHVRHIAAVPTGETGNILRLIVLTKERHGWAPDKRIWLERRSVIDGECGYWMEDAAPIQQVCFAQSEERSAFLALRFPTRTVLLRPLLHGRPKPAIRSPFYSLPASRVDPHPVLSIPFSQTGVAPHADVTFNPAYQRQLGIVDQYGNWSIWEIESGYKGKSKYSISAVTAGAITPVEIDTEEVETPTREDGWARILWIGDVNTVLVCNRRHLEVYGIRGGQTVPLKSWEPVTQRSTDWILDVKKHATNTHQFFVLTSTRLFLVAVICQNDVLGNADVEPGATVLLSWAHFRGTEDITLQLSVASLSDEESRILLFSRLNTLVTAFQFQYHELDPLRPFSSSDPTSLQLDDLFDSSDTRHISSLHLDQLHFREDPRTNSGGPGSSYMENQVRFYRLSAVFSDLSIRQLLLYSHPPESGDTPTTNIFIEPPSWSAIVPPRTGGRSSWVVREDADFVVPDGLDTVSAPTLKFAPQPKRLALSRRSSPVPGMSQYDPSTVDYGYMYGAVVQTDDVARGTDNLAPGTEEISVIIDRLRNLLINDMDGEVVPRGTIFESSRSSIRVSDVDDASSKLQDLFSHEGPTILQRIAPGETLHLSDAQDESTISSLYDTMLENWIAPLPKTVSNRVRQSKERLARRIASELMLASAQIRYPQPNDAPLADSYGSAGLSQDSTVSLRIPGPWEKSSQSAPLFSSQPTLFSSQPNPFSSQREQSTQPSALPTHPNPITRLSQYLQISKLPPKPSPNISQILMHWTPGADPSSYDWEATTRAIDEELGRDLDEEEIQQNNREKDKLRRKAERLAKRQKRELEIEKRKVESQPLPLLFGRERMGLRSSPVPAMGGMGSSQVGMGGSSQMGMGSQSQSQSQGFVGGFGGVQSQVEPGRHGARAVEKKKKKKKRVGGF